MFERFQMLRCYLWDWSSSLCLLLLLRCVLPLCSFSHLTKLHANHSAAPAPLDARGSFNRCQCASYGRRFNQLLQLKRGKWLKCSNFVPLDVKPHNRRRGENPAWRTFFICLLGLFFICCLFPLGLEPSQPLRAWTCVRLDRTRNCFYIFSFSAGGEV